MWWRWWTAPAWWRVLEFALLYGAVFAIGSLVEGTTSPGDVVVPALAGGAVFGLVLGPERARSRTRFLRALPAGTTPEQVRAAIRTSRRGPVPSDPVVRVAALVLLRQRVDAVVGGRRASLVVGVCGTVAALSLAVSARPVWAVLAACFAWVFVQALLGPRRLAHRLAVVEGD